MKKRFSPRNRINQRYSEKSRIIFIHGDAKEKLDSIPDGKIQLIITSPPYNIGKEYEKRVPLDKYLNGQKEILKQLVRVLKKNGSICWQVGTYVKNGEVYPLDIFFYDVFKKLGLKLRNRIVWHYRHGLHATTRFSGRYETILWFTKSDKYVFNLNPVRIPARYPGKRHYKGPRKGKPSGHPLGKNPSDIWDIVARDWKKGIWDIPNVKAKHPEKTIQPCQFPIELVERCVLALTKPGDLVLDPFAGVGSTMIGALRQQRRTIGIEKKRGYYNIALKRFAQYKTGKLPVRPINRPVYAPSSTEKVAQIPTEWLRKKRRKTSKTATKKVRRKKSR